MVLANVDHHLVNTLPDTSPECGYIRNGCIGGGPKSETCRDEITAVARQPLDALHSEMLTKQPGSDVTI